MNSNDLAALTLSLQLASVTTACLLLLGTPLAWWLARTRSRWAVPIQTLVALPLVLPPTVLGFYLLLSLSPQGPVGQLSEWLGGPRLVFSFTGLVIGSIVYSLPFVVQPLQNAFTSIGRRPLDVAASLRAGPWDTFFRVVVPLARPGYLTAGVLGFAHTLGEFGVVLMIGGNIPGQTQVASIAIYEHVEALAYQQAHGLAAVLVVLSVLMLLVVYGVNRRASWIK
jgi:molybdate transport system permease protein